MSTRTLTRRRFLRCTGAGAGLLLAGGLGPAEAQPARAAEATVEINLRAEQTQVALLAGRPTTVFGYRAELVKGDAAVLQTLPDTYLGPILRLRQGQHLRVNFTNRLPEATTIHWHGLRVPPAMDGHPMNLVQPGSTFAYEFDVLNRAGPYWFHPHPHERTGYQVYCGLAGLIYVTDDDEARLGLATGEHDLPAVIQERGFDANNQLVYVGGMYGAMAGRAAARILVNGRLEDVHPVAAQPYRLRLLNGSNTRIYRLAWADASAMTIVGVTGGLLAAPVQRSSLLLAPGQRVDLWVDLTGKPVGSEAVLQSLPWAAGMGMGMQGGMGMMGMMGGMSMGSPGQSTQREATEVLRLRVDRPGSAQVTLPPTLSATPAYRVQDAANASSPRRFDLTMGHMMAWGINGRTFEMDQVAEDEKIPFRTLELWEFANATMMPHPMHVHGVQFRIAERTALWQAGGYAQIEEGLFDEGWQDDVLVLPGERVRVLIKFEDYTGMYMIHCHNLEHDDMGMMRNIMVG